MIFSAGIVFFGTSLMASLLLLHLATNWKKVNSDFAEMEFKLQKYNYPNGISAQFKIVTFVFMVLALGKRGQHSNFLHIPSVSINSTFFSWTCIVENRSNAEDTDLLRWRCDYECHWSLYSKLLFRGNFSMQHSSINPFALWLTKIVYRCRYSRTFPSAFG